MFLLLAVDQRLRCSEVSLAWRALLADTSFWKRLDLSSSSDVASFSVPLFRAVVAKAGGQLICLDVMGGQEEYLPAEELFEVVESNTATLTELRVEYMLSHDIYALLDTKHSLQILETDVSLP